MKMKIVVAVALIATGLGCSSGGGGGSSTTPVSAPASKAVWATWTSNDNSVVLNLNGGQFGVQSLFSLTLPSTGVTCRCLFLANGTNSNGTYTFSACAYFTGGSGDPGCYTINQTGTFTNNGVTLTACTSTTCTSYH